MSSCLFCDIAAGGVPCTQIAANNEFMAFRDIAPQAPVHILVIPRRHITGLTALEPADADLVGRLVIFAKEIAVAEGLADNGYRFVINCGDEGGQTVDHLHLHLLGGRPMNWPPG